MTFLRVQKPGSALSATLFTLGVGDLGQLGWAGRLVRDFTPPDVRITYYNLGIRSETSTNLAARWERELVPRLRPDIPGGVVVSIGVNDTMPQNVDDHPIERTIVNLDSIISGIEEHQLPVWVVGLLPVADDSHNQRIQQQDTKFQAWCSEHYVEYTGVFHRMAMSPTWMREVKMVDGHHPGPAGYAELTHVLAGPWSSWLHSVLKSGTSHSCAGDFHIGGRRS